MLALYTLKLHRELSGSMEPMVQDLAKTIGEGLRVHVDTELAPLKVRGSQIMGNLGAMGNMAKQVKTAERYIAQDLVNMQDPVIVAALELLSPRTKEYLEKNPDLIMQLLPRLKALQESGDPLGFLKPGGPGHKKHPYE